RVYFPLRFDETGEPVCPGVQFREHLFVTRQIFCLIVAVYLIFSKSHVLPQCIGNFHATISTLPHQWRVPFALVFEWFLVGIEIMFVSIVEELRPTCRIE